MNLGSQLMPPRAGENSKGYFEHLAIYREHESLLRNLGRSWEDLRPMPKGWIHSPAFQQSRNNLVDILRDDFSRSSLWGVKDPRICRLLPLWREVLQDLSVQPIYILVLRHPKEVAASLFKRNGFSVEKSGILWAAHCLEAEYYTRNQRRHVLHFEQLLRAPEQVLGELGRRFDVDWPRPIASAAEELRSFLDPSLRSTVGNESGAPQFLRSSHLVGSLWELLLNEKHCDNENSSQFDTLYQEYLSTVDQIEPLLFEQANLLSSVVLKIGELSAKLDEVSARFNRVTEAQTEWLKAIDDQVQDPHRCIGKRKRRRLSKRVSRLFAKLRRFVARPAGDLKHQENGSAKIEAAGQTRKPVAEADPRSLIARIEQDGLAFPECNKPAVSIVIPVFNQISVTADCLQSIASRGEQESYEVIVVDDASTDATSEVLSHVPNLRVLSNDDNLGFVDSCNKGAAEARGEYILFLNNDTLVQDGWLDSLVQTFRDFENAGLVGSKLVNADGSLQEAGGLIWRDASGWNVGRGEDPNSPEFNYAREVDYCSGACLMIQRSLFTELGMFDTRYRPGYYEDVELAFRVRQTGKRVIYQPQSQVVHLEGASSGTDLTKGMKKFQRINQAKFVDRWRETLATHGASGTNREREKERKVRRRVLVVDRRIPTPDQDSGSLRMWNLIRILQDQGFKVTFLPDDCLPAQPYTAQLQARGVEVLHGPFVTRVRDHFKKAAHPYDLVLVSRVDIASKHADVIRATCPSARIVFDTVDLHFLRKKREAELKGESGAASEAQWQDTMGQELGVAKTVDVTLVVSPAEKQLLSEIDPALNVHVVSNIHEIFGTSVDFEHRKDLMFIGGFEHAPNVDAAKWLAGEIMPLVWNQLPQTRLWIIGSKPTGDVWALQSNRIRVIGHVPDVKPYFESVRLSVAPLRFGAGIKGKVNQSLAFGVPCVATSIAAEGMQLTHGKDIMIADNSASFAQMIVRVHEDEELWRRLSSAGLENVEKYFSFRAAEEAVKNLTHELLASPLKSAA